MAFIKSWTVSDALWERVEPLVPKHRRDKGRKYERRPGGGRKRMQPRRVFEAIVYVLRTGCQWKALPKEYGSASSVHGYFLEWKRCGVFAKLWRRGLAEYDDMEGIAWSWQSIDGAMVKAPLAQEAVEWGGARVGSPPVPPARGRVQPSWRPAETRSGHWRGTRPVPA